MGLAEYQPKKAGTGGDLKKVPARARVGRGGARRGGGDRDARVVMYVFGRVVMYVFVYMRPLYCMCLCMGALRMGTRACA